MYADHKAGSRREESLGALSGFALRRRAPQRAGRRDSSPCTKGPERSDKVEAYEVIALLGSGGMGDVYRARDTRLSRDVAIKILPDLFARHADRRARFEREAQTVASLSYPKIVNVFDTGSRAVFVTLDREEIVRKPILFVLGSSIHPARSA